MLKNSAQLSKIIYREGIPPVHPNLYALYQTFDGQKSIECFTKCPVELIQKINEECEKLSFKTNFIELCFCTANVAKKEVYASKLPEKIDFAKIIPFVFVPAPIWDDKMEIYRYQIFLMY